MVSSWLVGALWVDGPDNMTLSTMETFSDWGWELAFTVFVLICSIYLAWNLPIQFPDYLQLPPLSVSLYI